MTHMDRIDFHVHSETPKAAPAGALSVAMQKGLRIGLVDHILGGRGRLMPPEIKSVCRQRVADVGVWGLTRFGEGRTDTSRSSLAKTPLTSSNVSMTSNPSLERGLI